MRTTRNTDKERPVGAKEKTWSDRGKLAVPRERATGTGKRPVAPKVGPASMKERTAAPRDRTAPPRDRASSPAFGKERTSYPKERPAAPRERPVGTGGTVTARDRTSSPPAFGKERTSFSKERSVRKPVGSKPPSRIIREEPARDVEANRSDFLAGRNPIIEALRSGRPISKIFILAGERQGSVREIIGLAKDREVLVQETEQGKLDQMSPGVRHQGVVALVSPVAYSSVEAILQYAQEKGERPCIILLDGLKDPQNLGNLIRSAEVAGAHGILIPQRRNVQLSGAVAKSSAGAVEYMKVAQVGNVAQTLAALKKQGLWVIGADAQAQQVYYETDLTGPVVIVIGGEGEGMARLTKDRCDKLVRIPVHGRIGSLNAATAGAVLLFDVARQRAAGKA